MDARLRIMRHKFQFLWIGFAVLAIISLLAFLLLNASFRNASGAFDRQSMAYMVSPDIGAKDIERIEVDASNIPVEIGMASNINKLRVGLYGDGYVNQKVKVDVAGDRVVIHYPEKKQKRYTKDLTMRIMIPQDSLRELSIKSEKLNLNMDDMRADSVKINCSDGALRLMNINANEMLVEAGDASVRAEDNYVTQFVLLGGKKDVILRNNKNKLLETFTESGNVFLYGTTWRGQYRVMTSTGHITAVSKRLPWSLMISANALGTGDVKMNYDRRFWKKPDIVEANAHTWRGSVGNNPSNAFDFVTEDGHITIQERERYTDVKTEA